MDSRSSATVSGLLQLLEASLKSRSIAQRKFNSFNKHLIVCTEHMSLDFLFKIPIFLVLRKDPHTYISSNDRPCTCCANSNRQQRHTEVAPLPLPLPLLRRSPSLSPCLHDCLKILQYRRIPIIKAPVIFGFSSPKGPLLSGGRYFRVAVTFGWLENVCNSAVVLHKEDT